MNLDSTDQPYWKEIWLVCSGQQETTARETVKQCLKKWKGYFLVGLHQFTSGKSEDLHQTQIKLNLNERLWDIVKRLHHFLDLKAELASTLLTQYLLYAFHGTPTTLQNLTLTHVSSTKLLQDVWHFYTSERMFYLNTLKRILEFHTDEDHPYYTEFSEFVEDADIGAIRESLVSQLKLLISVNNTPSEDMNSTMQSLWIDRNLREQLEVLQCIILSHDVSHISPDEVVRFLEYFSCHRFGCQPIYQNAINATHHEALKRLTMCEVGLLICAFDNKFILKNVAQWNRIGKTELDGWISRLMNEFGPELTPVVFAWMLVRCNYKYEPNPDLVQTAIVNLQKILNSSIFKDDSKCSKIIRRSAYDLIQLMMQRECEFRNDVVLYECLSIVLKDAELADSYWLQNDDKESGTVKEKWFFPADFVSYSLVATGLASAGRVSLKKVMADASELPVTCIPYNDDLHKLLIHRNNTLYLTTDLFPMKTPNIRIASGSAVILEPPELPTTAHFQNSINYWKVLEQLIIMSESNLQEGLAPPFMELKVGFNFWLSVLNNITSNQVTNYIIKPALRLFDLINEMLIKRMTNTDIFALGLEVITAIQRLCPNAEMYDKLRSTNLFPVVINKNLKLPEFIKPTNFIQGQIFELILNCDMIHGKYDLLRAYLKFLHVRFEQKCADLDSFEIPGVIFILQDVLPKFADWNIEVGSVEQEIIHDTISMIFNVLRVSNETMKNPKFELLQKVCIFDLLHIANGIVVLNIVARGNRHLELLMQNQTNWLSGPGVQYLHIVQMCFSILMLLFQKKSLIAKKDVDMPLEVVMFTQPKEEDALKIIRNIASYMDHTFNKQLPVLACRILRKFALKLQISLHGCFDMDSDQIRHVFVHRLRSKEDSDSLKIAILDFIIACVRRQPGLTQAFFSNPIEEGETREETLLGLMEDVLDILSLEAGFLNFPTLSSVMSLFHELWKNQKQAVVSAMRKDETFWEKLCSPLKFQILPELKAYSQIFNIISLEIYANGTRIEPPLYDLVSKFLNPDCKDFTKWLQYIFVENLTLIKENAVALDYDVPNWLSLLQSWKDFVCVCVHRCPLLITDRSKAMLGDACLRALAQELDVMHDSRAVTVLSELYVIMLSSWKLKLFNDVEETIGILSKLVILTKTSYKSWHYRIRIAMLSITVTCIRLLKTQIKDNEQEALKMFNYSCQMASDELYLLEVRYQSTNVMTVDQVDLPLKCVSHPEVDVAGKMTVAMKEAILKMNLLNEMLVVCYDFDELYRCCIHMKLCLRLVQCLGWIVQVRQELPVTLAILDCLTYLAKTKYGEEFLHCEFSLQLWVKFLPPKELLKKDRDPFDEGFWKIEEWWSVYQRMILIVGLLLRKFTSRFLEDALSFVVIHDAYLIDYILLAKQTVELNALEMVEATVTFTHEIMKHQKQWKPYHGESFIGIVRALQSTLYYSIALLLRPAVVKHSVNNRLSDADDPLPSGKVTTILNKYIDIIIRISQVLSQLSPSLTSLLCDHDLAVEQCSLMLELQFNMPKLTNEEEYDLSFGTVMSAVHLFSRSLNHIHAADSKGISNSKTGSPLDARHHSLLSTASVESPIPKSLQATLSSESIALDLYSSSPSVSTTSPIWMRYLDPKKCLRALEALLTFLASQTLVYLMDRNEPRKNRQYVCREINADLVCFHEYVKKITKGWSSRNFEDYAGISRTKYGSTPLRVSETKIKPRNIAIGFSRLANPYTGVETSEEEIQLREKIASVNPALAQMRAAGDQVTDGDPMNVLTKVQFMHPDYLVFLSNLFMSICKKEDL